MARFLTEADYDGKIKAEIKKVVTGTTGGDPTAMQLLAEDTAITQISNDLGTRYDISKIFIPPGDPDTRDKWIIKCVITLALFELYHQTGWQDIPEHRKLDYDNVTTWLRDVGLGRRPAAMLPPLPVQPSGNSDVRFNSRPLDRGRW